jgi:hypothetical protein
MRRARCLFSRSRVYRASLCLRRAAFVSQMNDCEVSPLSLPIVRRPLHLTRSIQGQAQSPSVWIPHTHAVLRLHLTHQKAILPPRQLAKTAFRAQCQRIDPISAGVHLVFLSLRTLTDSLTRTPNTDITDRFGLPNMLHQFPVQQQTSSAEPMSCAAKPPILVLNS